MNFSKRLPVVLILLLVGLLAAPAQAQDTEILKEKEIALKDAPKAVQKAVQDDYPDAKIKEVDEITTQDGTVYYEIELVFEGEKLEVMYEADGQFIGSESDDDEESEEEEPDGGDDDEEDD